MQNMIFVLYPLFCILLPCMLYVLIQTKVISIGELILYI